MIDEFSANDLDKIHGWTLRQLFQRFVVEHPAVWEKWHAAIYERPDFDLNVEDVSKLLPDAVWPLNVNPETLSKTLCATRNARGSEKAVVAVQEIFIRYNAMIDLFRGGFLIAAGTDTHFKKTKTIEANWWWACHAAIDLKSNALISKLGPEPSASYSAINIDRRTVDFSAYNGRPLSEAFHMLVLKDHALYCATQTGNEPTQFLFGNATLGIFWRPDNNSATWWPLELAGYIGKLPNATSDHAYFCECIVSDLLRQFLAPVRNGDVVATGLNASDQYIKIPKTLWWRPQAYINSLHSSLGWREDPDEDAPNPKMQTRFTDIELSLAEQHSPQFATAEADVEKEVQKQATSGNSASDAEITRLIENEFARAWRPKRKIVPEIAAQTGASKRRVSRFWDALTASYPERSKPGRRKESSD